MARTHGRLFCSIWDDEDFLALTPEAKNVYSFLISQEDLSHAGTIIMRAPLWAEMIGYTNEQTDAALDELHAARFVVADRRRFELLVRSLIRRDGVYRQPNVYKSAVDHIYLVKSKPIRAVLLSELTRLDESGMNAEICKVHHGVIDWLRANSGSPSPNPSAKGSGNPSGNPSANPVRPDSENSGPDGSEPKAMSEIRQNTMITLTLVDNDGSAGQNADGKGSQKGSPKGSLARASSPYPFPPTNKEPSSSATATPLPDDSSATESKRGRKKPHTEPEPRPDVEALCNRLFEMMTARGCRTTPITDTWRNEARLLLDKDGIHFQFAMDVLEWSQKSSFWKTNILSMPKFRKQWNTLYQQAEADCGPHPNNGRNSAPVDEVVSFGGNVVELRPSIPAPRPSTTDQRVAQAKAAGQRFAAQFRAAQQARAEGAS